MINENEVTEVTENEQDVTEVTEVTENEQAQIQAELERQEQERLEQERIEAERQAEIERQEAEERAREQARIEHENFLNSFPETTVFYRELKEEDNVKWLCGTVKDAHTAESYGWLDNHYDESELTLIGNIYYLKGYEKPEQSEEELQLERYHLIDSQIEAYLDARVKEHNYKSVESCVSYFNSTDDKYRAEARAVSTWRDHIYHTGEQVWQSVLNGSVDYKDVDLAYIINIAGDFSWDTNV